MKTIEVKYLLLRPRVSLFKERVSVYGYVIISVVNLGQPTRGMRINDTINIFPHIFSFCMFEILEYYRLLKLIKGE